MKRKEAIKKAAARWSRYCDSVLIKIVVTLIFYIAVAIIYPEHYK